MHQRGNLLNRPEGYRLPAVAGSVTAMPYGVGPFRAAVLKEEVRFGENATCLDFDGEIGNAIAIHISPQIMPA